MDAPVTQLDVEALLETLPWKERQELEDLLADAKRFRKLAVHARPRCTRDRFASFIPYTNPRYELYVPAGSYDDIYRDEKEELRIRVEFRAAVDALPLQLPSSEDE